MANAEREAAERAVKSYNEWIMSLIESQSKTRPNEAVRAEKLAQFQYAMAQLQNALR